MEYCIAISVLLFTGLVLTCLIHSNAVNKDDEE